MRKLTIIAATLALLGDSAVAQSDYPTRAVTVIVPFAAGGPTDTVARLVVESMTRTLGQQVLVENATGAGGTLGARRVATADPDGYTLLLHHIGQATSASLYRKLPYDPATAFASIGLITDVPMTVVSKSDLEPSSIGELITYIKTNKDQVTLAHAGVGAVSHLCGVLLQDALATKMTTVPYKGTGPAMTDLLGGQVDLLCDQTTNTTGPIKTGKVKAYAVTTSERVATLPDLPTLDEAGLKGFEVTAWHALYAPKGTPKEVVDELAGAVQVALKDPKVVERFADLGTTPVPQEQATPAALEQHLQAEIVKWKSVLQKTGEYAD
ncbi:MAG: tripartite tricarboxylate transporter substrate binding protein BugD [Thermomicrobiales bacterium]|jgi:tripartite-type tricarboxylate transporter receptor subunit TctC|nr:tripartite tricarboxylate transporter substrate binding protein BugD [Geminicoccaceae bacterium]MDF3015704.1 tripartite tricarboxylate transporter substrate binding protein BugD [Thermomicrobiales bacterium]